jgi:hypothetical protein
LSFNVEPIQIPSLDSISYLSFCLQNILDSNQAIFICHIYSHKYTYKGERSFSDDETSNNQIQLVSLQIFY